MGWHARIATVVRDTGHETARKQCCCPLLPLQRHGVHRHNSGSQKLGWCRAHQVGGLGSGLLRLVLVGLQATTGLWCLGDSDRHRGMGPGQVSPLRALLGTGHCGNAHISGRRGASSCPANSLSPLWGTRWNRAARSQAKQRSRHPPFPPQPRPSRPSVTRPTGGKGVWDHTVASSARPQGTQRLTLAPSSPPPQPGPHRRKQVAGNAGRSNSWLRSVRAAGAAHSRHRPGDSVPAPSAGSAHGSALSLIGPNSLLLDAHWSLEI